MLVVVCSPRRFTLLPGLWYVAAWLSMAENQQLFLIRLRIKSISTHAFVTTENKYKPFSPEVCSVYAQISVVNTSTSLLPLSEITPSQENKCYEL